MPRFTAVIPVYRSEDYLHACLDSLKAQTFADWNAVIVLDGSTDSSPWIARSYEKADPRFSVVELPHNQGRHAARKAGVAQATGEYVCFLDSDDTFEAELFAKLDAALLVHEADAVHFGMTLVAEDGMAPERSRAFEAFVNAPDMPLVGLAPLVRAFCLREGGRDWRLTQRAYRREVIQRAFAASTDTRLDVAEDVYEYFCVACLLQSEITCNDARLMYHLGRGISGVSQASPEELLAIARHYGCSVEAIQQYAQTDGRNVVQRAAFTLKLRLFDELGTVWADRCPQETRLEMARQFAQVVSARGIATQLARIARDEAYGVFVADCAPEERDITAARSLVALAQELAELDDDDSFTEDYVQFIHDAQLHIGEVEQGLVPEWRRVPEPEPPAEPEPAELPQPVRRSLPRRALGRLARVLRLR